jgi:hypothetical protein
MVADITESALTVKLSQQAQRLEIVQAAARHLLDVASKKDDGFGTMDIYPEDLGRPAYNTPDSTWRGQIAWCWAKAGYLDQKISGQGTKKHWIYKLLPRGRRPLEMIASDPVLASHYVSIKRPSNPGADYPPSWYQPPSLRDLPPEPDPPKPKREKLQLLREAPESRVEEPVNDVDADPIEQVGELTSESQAEGDDYFLRIFLERNTQALEATFRLLGEIKKEVKDQSDLVVDAVQRLEGAASKSDVAEVAAEIAAVLSRQRSTDQGTAILVAEVEKIRTVFDEQANFHVRLMADLNAILDRRKVDESAFADKLAGLIVSKLKKDYEKNAETISKSAANAVESIEWISKQTIVNLDKLKDGILASIAAELKKIRAAGKGEDIQQLGDQLAALAADANDITELLEQISDAVIRVNTSFVDGMAEFKAQATKVSESHRRSLETASELMSAARIVVKEMLDTGAERAASSGMSFSTVKQRALGAIDRLNEAEEEIQGRSFAGESLIRPQGFRGSGLALGGGVVPLPPGVDASKPDEEDDEDEDEKGEES